jgi:lysophospholipase L1-like esterase
MDSWYWVHTPNTVINNQKKEFVFNREVNSIGLSEKEKGSKFRILAIGDSFTESVGVSYEDSWVKQMESRWKSKNVQSINAGVGGSDPVYEFALYRDKLVELEPDVVVLTINSTDVSDIVGRGGFERFRADGTAGKEPPSWEWIYASNHLFRMVMHSVFNYNSNLIRNANSEESQMQAVSILKETLSELKNTCAQNNTKLLVVLQPSIQEFKEGIHTPFFGQRSLENYMKSEKIHFLDASPQFQSKGKSVSDYYYPLDTHFNKKGYALFGETVYQKIEELKFLDK